ncbi:hypothetical protein DNH61_04850 [Paenibacillus sambharensis]|uniref:Uncharacterized protein n=1 Tax=Paenibacillus sambharensis TaxID=1803190 RepID=A0A2W1L9T4_9BACL|nr:hypothetical protein [Paenibacillus sambharensis]PZD96978.1 hypothetical protein DNH61_04850 [Paenibacillus sambharensis]
MEDLNRTQNNQSNIVFYFMLSISIIGSIVILFQNIFQWTIVEFFTPFIAQFIEIFGYLIFALCSLIVLIYFVVGTQRQRTRRGIPILLNMIVLILVIVVPFTSITVNLNFRFNKSEREEVVQMILDGSIRPNVSYNSALIQLPDNYKKLSKGGGEIVIEGNGSDVQVLFYTYRGVIDNYAGFIYTADGGRPNEIFGEFIQVEKMGENWFWVSAT